MNFKIITSPVEKNIYIKKRPDSKTPRETSKQEALSPEAAVPALQQTREGKDRDIGCTRGGGRKGMERNRLGGEERAGGEGEQEEYEGGRQSRGKG